MASVNSAAQKEKAGLQRGIANIEEEIASTQATLDKTFILNFGKKGELKTQIKDLKKDLKTEQKKLEKSAKAAEKAQGALEKEQASADKVNFIEYKLVG